MFVAYTHVFCFCCSVCLVCFLSCCSCFGLFLCVHVLFSCFFFSCVCFACRVWLFVRARVCCLVLRAYMYICNAPLSTDMSVCPSVCLHACLPACLSTCNQCCGRWVIFGAFSCTGSGYSRERPLCLLAVLSFRAVLRLRYEPAMEWSPALRQKRRIHNFCPRGIFIDCRVSDSNPVVQMEVSHLPQP